LPFFSIIIPTYNRAHTIRRAIESVLAQTYADWELIIVDDGSTDKTAELVRSYEDRRIRYVWQENKERSAARNHGVQLAMGEYMCFMDSDDEILSEHLYILAQNLPNSQNVIVRTGVAVHHRDKWIANSHYGDRPKDDIYPWECFTAAAYHRSIFNDKRFDSRYKASEDLLFLMRLYADGHEMKVQPQYTYIYHNENSRQVHSPLFYKNKINCLNEVLTLKCHDYKTYIKMIRAAAVRDYFRSVMQYKWILIPKAVIMNVREMIFWPKAYFKI
jgi:glycosyltransferase involved in cell wall biosynthesis